MKTKFLILEPVVCLCLLMNMTSCKKSVEEEFNNANGTTAEKYIKRFEIVSNDVSENKTFIVNYDGENRVSSIVEGSSSNVFSYNSTNNLSSVTDNGEQLDINELYQSPYDAFETGNVMEYDSKSNPKKIEVYQDGYNSNVLFGEITYDPTPNPFFYTLKAGKIIDVLDRVDLNFGVQSPSLIKAKLLLPYNNIKSMIFKDLTGNTKYDVQINSTYDAKNYPTQATVSVISPKKSYTYLVKYFYR